MVMKETFMKEELKEKNMWVTKRIKAIGIFILLSFMMIGFIGFFMCASDSGKKTEIYYECRDFGGEFLGMDVDKEGNIYIAEDIKDIIQVYDPTGQFLYGIECDANGGTFSFDNIDNVTYISISRGNDVKIANGKIYELAGENENYSMATR